MKISTIKKYIETLSGTVSISVSLYLNYLHYEKNITFNNIIFF